MNADSVQALQWLAAQGAKFALPFGRTKNKFEMDWPNKPHTYQEALTHAKSGGNNGILTGKHSANIVAIDRDVDFAQTVTMLGDLGKTTKIIRSNAPDRGKFLYKIDGAIPPTAAWKPKGAIHPEAEFLGDNGQRHALCPPSEIDGGSYQLIDTEYGIQTITANELDYIWRLITGGSIYKDVRAQEETETNRQANDEYISQTKDAWTVRTVFEHFDKAQNGTELDRGETRVLGNGGLLISADGTQWYDHADSIGGDKLDAWAWCKWEKRVDRKNPKMFWDVIDDMAGVKGIVKPKLYTNGTGHKAEPEPEKEETGRPDIEQILLKEGAHDEGNAQCVNVRYYNQFVHNDEYGWLHYNGSNWAREGAEELLDRAIVETMQARINATIASGQVDQYKQIVQKAVPTSSHISGAKYCLDSLLYVPYAEFETNPDLLNCKNGTVDLRTGELLRHSPLQRLMHCTPVDYDPNADLSTWVDFVNTAVGEDTADWLQMAMGYSLTGHTREEVLFYLFGPSRSGKGTFTEAILSLLGTPLADVVSFNMLTAPREADTQNFNLAPLHNARFVAASESNVYERFNEAKVKTLTGGDKIQCSFKHKTPFSYRPKYKIWLSSNQTVNADPDDDAVWGRIRVIHFPTSHLGDEDKVYKEQMRSEAALRGALVWGVQGAMRWYKLGGKGLPELAKNKELKDEQRSELDHVSIWLDENCTLRAEYFTPSSELYTNYYDWCKANGVTPKQQKAFSQALKRKGFTDKLVKHEGKPKRGFYGVMIG